MASSSGAQHNPCANTICKRGIRVPRPGWRFLDWEVELCNQCYIAYMTKQFCNIYHKNSTGWSFCRFCNKKIHRACIVSLDLYTTLEDGGIECKGCAPQDATLEPYSQENMQESTSPPTPLASVPQTQVENNELIIIIDDEDSHEAKRSTSPPVAQAQARTEEPSLRTSRKHDLYRYTPRMTNEELQEIFKGSNVEVTALFEKVLTASDTGKSGRLVLPKRCAEEFFPSVDDSQCHHVEIQDFEGKDWKFRLRMWPNNNSKMYVLEGFEPYVRSKKLVEGDTVTFCRLVPDGKLVIGYRKGQYSSSNQGNNTASTSKHVSKDKRTRKPNVVKRAQPGIVIAEGGVGARRKTSKVRLTRKIANKQKKRLEVVERAPGQLDLPRGSNVPSDTAEQGFKRRQGKGILRTSTSKSMRKCKTKSTTRNSGVVIRNVESEPSEPMETEAENAVTLVVPPRWIKKHPRHRTICMCKACMAPASEPMQNLPNQSASGHAGTSNAVREEPESPNRDAQMNASGNGAEDDQNLNNVSGSQSRGLLFDLNVLPEIDEEELDAMDVDQETPSGGEM